MASPVHKVMAQTVFNCGKCLVCRKRQSSELAMRCVLHSSLYKENCFLTLTYDEKISGYHNEREYGHIQKFKKALRSRAYRRDGRRIQIFNVHEYGENGKKHWHLVVFNYDFQDKTLHTIKNSHRLHTSKELSKLWKFGNHTIGTVTEASAMYQAQYTQKDLKNGYLETSRKAHSKHSGIGREYFLRHYEQILRLGYVPFGGQKRPIPRYFYKLSHKHYSHFYAPENFEDTLSRKRLYTKFRDGQASRHIADLFQSYHAERQKKIIEMSLEWEAYTSEFRYTDEKTEFQQSGENQLYDLKNKNKHSNF